MYFHLYSHTILTVSKNTQMAHLLIIPECYSVHLVIFPICTSPGGVLSISWVLIPKVSIQ